MADRSRKQAVIYCRVSSVKQTTDGDGLRSQETRCREFARRKGHAVTNVFQDDVSGSLTERPGMKAMLTFIRKRKAAGTVVIIDDVSRLARGLQAHLELRAAIANAGGMLESPSIEFGEDPDSLLVENSLASVSQHQRQKNGEQTKNRMHARMINGYAVFHAPIGYTYQRVAGRGRMLKRQEPSASIIAEALEGYASGRFEIQADVVRFLQAHPLFPKDRAGEVSAERVRQILTQPLYAGYVTAPDWGVSLRPGQHEGLVSFQTFQRIQERLQGVGRAKARKNLNEDFPLRGFVACDDCSAPLTACWAAGRTSRHPYYHCQKRGCVSYGKSVRRDVIEGEFVALLKSVQPTASMVRVATTMFQELWERRVALAGAQAKALSAELVKIERQIGQFLERIVTTDTPSVIGAYEERVRKLEEKKLLLREQMAGSGSLASSFDATLRTALNFLANPSKLWDSGLLESRRTVLKLTFADQLRYRRNEGFRTTSLSLPFKALAGILESKMYDPRHR